MKDRKICGYSMFHAVGLSYDEACFKIQHKMMLGVWWTSVRVQDSGVRGPGLIPKSAL